jgi:hypothetical protein
MAQVKVNGAVAADQFLTGSLNWFIVDAGVAVNTFGYDANGDAVPGEQLVELLQDVVNAVIIQPDGTDANVHFVATEVEGIDPADVAAVINGSTTFSAATVTAGTLAVV